MSYPNSVLARGRPENRANFRSAVERFTGDRSGVGKTPANDNYPRPANDNRSVRGLSRAGSVARFGAQAAFGLLAALAAGEVARELQGALEGMGGAPDAPGGSPVDSRYRQTGLYTGPSSVPDPEGNGFWQWTKTDYPAWPYYNFDDPETYPYVEMLGSVDITPHASHTPSEGWWPESHSATHVSPFYNYNAASSPKKEYWVWHTGDESKEVTQEQYYYDLRSQYYLEHRIYSGDSPVGADGLPDWVARPRWRRARPVQVPYLVPPAYDPIIPPNSPEPVPVPRPVRAPRVSPRRDPRWRPRINPGWFPRPAIEPVSPNDPSRPPGERPEAIPGRNLPPVVSPRPAELPGPTTTVTIGRGVRRRTVLEPRPSFPSPPKSGEKERKFAYFGRQTVLEHLLHYATEGLEILDAAHDALPKECQARPARLPYGAYKWYKERGRFPKRSATPQAKAAAVFRCFDELDGEKFLNNVLQNQFEDAVIGKLSRGGGSGLLLGDRPFGLTIGPAL